MTFSNPWFIAALVGVLGLFHLEIIATFLNLAQFRHALPQRLKEIFSDETVQKAGEYAATSSKLDLLRSTASVAVLIAFWWGGGFGWSGRGLVWGRRGRRGRERLCRHHLGGNRRRRGSLDRRHRDRGNLLGGWRRLGQGGQPSQGWQRFDRQGRDRERPIAWDLRGRIRPHGSCCRASNPKG
jgi:hypothetical protein